MSTAISVPAYAKDLDGAIALNCAKFNIAIAISKQAKLLVKDADSRCMWSVIGGAKSEQTVDRTDDKELRCAKSGTGREDTEPRRLNLGMRIVDLTRRGLRSIGRLSRHVESVAAMATPRHVQLLIDRNILRWVESDTGSEDTESDRAIPNRTTANLEQAKDLGKNKLSKCKRSRTVSDVSRQLELCSGSDISRCVGSITDGEDKDPKRASPESDTTISMRMCNRDVDDVFK